MSLKWTECEKREDKNTTFEKKIGSERKRIKTLISVILLYE